MACRESLRQCSALWMRLRSAWRGTEAVLWSQGYRQTNTTSRWGHPFWEGSWQATRRACSQMVYSLTDLA